MYIIIACSNSSHLARANESAHMVTSEHFVATTNDVAVLHIIVKDINRSNKLKNDDIGNNA